MNNKIKIGITGYGNLGRGVERAVANAPDMEAVALLTRRDPATVQTATNIPTYRIGDAASLVGKVDVMIMCGGSANDLPKQTPEMAAYFHVIDSFDTHANIPEHYADVDAVCRAHGTLGIISVGWDPGLFSLMRCLGQSILPCGADYTFWGKGVSQGHSDAIRRIDGVIDARQYTIPVPSALERVRRGENPTLTTREKHTRECFVVAKEGADLAEIERRIVTMPNYFSDYDTTVHFITQEELDRDHKGIPHGGKVFRCGTTDPDGTTKHLMEFGLTLDSNPEFTASVLVAYARAAYRLSREGATGCKTVLDIPPAYLHPSTGDQLRKTLL